jgi:hypothetical protein
MKCKTCGTEHKGGMACKGGKGCKKGGKGTFKAFLKSKSGKKKA